MFGSGQIPMLVVPKIVPRPYQMDQYHGAASAASATLGEEVSTSLGATSVLQPSSASNQRLPDDTGSPP